MLKGLGDMGKLMKQAQEMQSKMQEAQEKLEDITVTGEAGAGMVDRHCICERLSGWPAY